MKTHDLKIWGIFFNAVVNGKKTFEIRKMDRDYQQGDYLKLREWDRNSSDYTGRECTAMITYVYRGDDYLQPSYGILGIKLVDEAITHEKLNQIEAGTHNEETKNLLQMVRKLDHEVQTDRFFRHHLSTELDKFCAKLNPLLRADLDKILIKLSAKAEYDF